MQNVGILFFLGIGDWIVSTPALQEVKKHNPRKKIFVVTGKEFEPLLKNNNAIDGYSLLPDYSVLTDNFKEDDFVLAPNYTYIRPWKACKRHVTDVYARIFGVGNCSEFPEIHLPEKDDAFGYAFSKRFKKRIIVVHASSSTPANRWDEAKWEKVIKKIKGYLFVQIGDRAHPPIKGALNMLGRTTLMEAFAIVKYAQLFVGVDGVFNHVANAFGVPKVILWGPHHPRFLGYTRSTINIFKKIRCSPCWPVNPSLLPRKCKLQIVRDAPCSCMSAIKAYDVQAAIEQLLVIPHKGGSVESMSVSETAKSCRRCVLRRKCNPDHFKVRLRDLKLLRFL